MPVQLRFRVKRQRLADGFGQRGGRKVGELDVVGVLRILDDVNHRVIQTSGGAHNGNRAVTKAVHLVQPARLESGRQEKEIAARLDAMRQTLIDRKSTPLNSSN